MLADTTTTDSKAFDATIAVKEIASHAALWQEAEGRRIYGLDVLLGIATLLGGVAVTLVPFHLDSLLVACPLLTLTSLFAGRVTRQMAAMRKLIARLEANAPMPVAQ